MSAQEELYTVMDSRANYDIDAASILECLDSKPSKKQFRKLKQLYGECCIVRMHSPKIVDGVSSFTETELVVI